MAVFALDGQPGLDPVLLAPGVIAHVRVAKRRQFMGGVLRSVSGGAGAVDHDLRRLVRQECGREFLHTVGGKVERARKVRVVVGRLGQSLDEQELIPPSTFPFSSSLEIVATIFVLLRLV